MHATAIGFIERCFENISAGDFANSGRHAQNMFFTLDDTRSGDERQRRVVPKRNAGSAFADNNRLFH
jgi:hypothetical protein